jgi:peptidoglycan hydrolase-like protein with peptidoglycan-binding domain
MGKVTGYFGSGTRSAVSSFQGDRGLEQTGTTDTATWKAMLAQLEPLPIHWTRNGAVAARSQNAMPEPRSARLPARAYEIPPGPRR